LCVSLADKCEAELGSIHDLLQAYGSDTIMELNSGDKS